MKEELLILMPAIRRFAYSLTGSSQDADDLLQNTVERVLSRGVPDDVELVKWAFRVCRNLWIDEYRARKVRRNDADVAALLDEQTIDGEKIICDQITLQQVNNAMAKLPDDQRSILALVAVQGMSYKEVAETLSIPIGTVMSRLARARIALSQYLKTTALEISQ
ncbi:MAG: RNA polymerase sigma factor [Pseudomonadota bacterium]